MYTLTFYNVHAYLLQCICLPFTMYTLTFYNVHAYLLVSILILWWPKLEKCSRNKLFAIHEFSPLPAMASIPLTLMHWYYWTHVQVPGAQWGQTNQNIGVWRREVFVAGPYKETGGSCSKTPKTPKAFQQNIIKDQVKKGCVVGFCKLLGVGILWSYSYLCGSCHNVPINLQQDKCYSLFCNF